jgi:hypothetical protein
MYEKLLKFTQAFATFLAAALLLALPFDGLSKFLGLQNAAISMIAAALLAGAYLLQKLFGKLAFIEALRAVSDVPLEELGDKLYKEIKDERRKDGRPL